jgi:hypothetical protein
MEFDHKPDFLEILFYLIAIIGVVAAFTFVFIKAFGGL